MGGGLDAKQFVYLPWWAKILCLAILGIGIAVSLAIILRFFGSSENRDWVLIGISGVQFLITTFVVAIVLFLSETDANIATLRTRSDTFLTETLPQALADVTLDDEAGKGFTVVPGNRRDIFGYHYDLNGDEGTVLRLWCGVNVRRLIVIYRFVDPLPSPVETDFEARIRDAFRFTFGGAESVGYGKPHIEMVPGDKTTASVWLTADLPDTFLTDPAAKLFWAQDVAMMTESLLRTAQRQSAVRLDTVSRPRPQ